MKAELDNPGSVQLTGRCDRLQTPTQWRSGGGRKMLWIALGASAAAILMVLLVLLIMHRGQAH